MSEQRERVFNAPGAVVGLIAILVGVFLVETYFGVETMADAWGFAPVDLSNGRSVTLLTAILLHGGWPHLLSNCLFALAFATPVARRLGEDGRGALAFFGFFVACGLIGNLGYWAADSAERVPEIGASGAIAGLMGAASRLLGQPPGQLAPFRSRTVIAMAGSWLVVNVVFGLLFIGWVPGSGGAPIAWQVHLVGYAAGLFLFAPLLALIGRERIDHGLEN